MGTLWDHLGLVLGQSVGHFFTLCSLFGTFWDVFGHTFGTLSENCFEQIAISKSNETLPDHFSIKNEASHEVERQIRRFVFSLDLFSKCCLIMSVNRMSGGISSRVKPCFWESNPIIFLENTFRGPSLSSATRAAAVLRRLLPKDFVHDTLRDILSASQKDCPLKIIFTKDARFLKKFQGQMIGNSSGKNSPQ